MKLFWVLSFTFVASLVLSATDAGERKRPRPFKPAHRLCTKTRGYRMVFPKRSIDNYALIQKAITRGLTSVTLCSFVKVNPNYSSDEKQCAYSYAVPGQHNELSFCPSPTLQVIINGASRKTSVSIQDGLLHHICFTWKSSGGRYQFFKDGRLVATGRGFKQGYTIKPKGTLVLGQDQDMLAGDFSEKEAFVGELSQLNVWDRVLSRRAIVTQHNMCYIGDGSVNKWEQFKSSVRGGVQVIPQQYA